MPDSRRGLPTGYRRAVESSIDRLTNVTEPPVASPSDTTDTTDTSGTSDSSGTQGVGTNAGHPSVPPMSTPLTKPKAEPREHVKLRRSLAEQMRDAVWWYSEHGRPRVQLGELLDEAVEVWLSQAKTRDNEGEDFPRRGRLR